VPGWARAGIRGARRERIVTERREREVLMEIELVN
jgi:hypothetical protein